MVCLTDNHWILYRFDPMRETEGFNHLQLDSKVPSIPIKKCMYSENRYRIPRSMDPVRAEKPTKLVQRDVDRRWNLNREMVEMNHSWAKQ